MKKIVINMEDREYRRLQEIAKDERITCAGTMARKLLLDTLDGDTGIDVVEELPRERRCPVALSSKRLKRGGGSRWR